MSKPVSRWAEPGYADIVGTAADLEAQSVRVDFANGDTVTLPLADVGIVSSSFSIGFDPDEGLSIDVFTPDQGTTTVSWSRIRAATDPAFAQELRRRDAEEARRLGARLRALREDKHLTQKAVASQMGMTTPQLSKIESGSYDLRTSTVQGLLRAMGGSYADIAGPNAPEVSQRSLRVEAERAGLPGGLIATLLAAAPRRLGPRLLERAFGWIAGGDGETATRRPLQIAVAFKSVSGIPSSDSPMVSLAVTLSQTLIDASDLPSAAQMSDDPLVLRRQVLEGHTTRVTFEALLEFAWRSGVAVLPLEARGGGFAAATWNLQGVPVIVLKESRPFVAYWLFDLAHEIGHLALGHTATTGLVDVESPNPGRAARDDQERAADEFALTLLMPNFRALVDEVRRETRGNYLRFKNAVDDVSARHDVSVGLLGMICAFELSDIGQDKDRWGSASNLARPEGEGRRIAVASAARRADLSRVDELDAALLSALVLSVG